MFKMAHQNSDPLSTLHMRKTGNRQHPLPTAPTHHNKQIHSPDILEHYGPKSPRITSQEGEEVEKLVDQMFDTLVNESDCILQNTPDMNDDAMKHNLVKQQNHVKDNVNSFRTLQSILVPVGHSTKFPRQTMTNSPEAPSRDCYFEPIDEVGLEDSASQVFQKYTYPKSTDEDMEKRPQRHRTNNSDTAKKFTKLP